MGFLNKLFLFGGIVSAIWLTMQWNKEVPIPDLKDEWWGEGKAVAVDETVKPFKISVPDDVGFFLQFENATTLTDMCSKCC